MPELAEHKSWNYRENKGALNYCGLFRTSKQVMARLFFCYKNWMLATTGVTGPEACYWKRFRPIIRRVDCAPAAPESSKEDGRLRKIDHMVIS